jgi:hypothetical protein
MLVETAKILPTFLKALSRPLSNQSVETRLPSQVEVLHTKLAAVHVHEHVHVHVHSIQRPLAKDAHDRGSIYMNVNGTIYRLHSCKHTSWPHLRTYVQTLVSMSVTLDGTIHAKRHAPQ